MTANATHVAPLNCQSWEYERPVPGGVVVAVDGSVESIAALNTGAAIARLRRLPLHAVTVIAPFPSYHLNPGIETTQDHVLELRVALKDSELGIIMNALEPANDWTHEVIVGRPARWVTRIAEQRGADLIVMGRREHGVMDRVLGSETTLQVMRTSSVPVLGVSAEIGRPKTIVVATDFSSTSAKAAELALGLLCGAGTIYLAHVESAVTTEAEEITSGDRRYPGDVVVWFRRMMADLSCHGSTFIEPVVLNGSAVQAITSFAERVGADLIAAGSHGHSKLERFLLGSVSTGLVRNAKCGVLVAPARSDG